MKAPILNGEKITLKPIKLSDAVKYSQWLTDTVVNRFMLIDPKDCGLRKEKRFIIKFLKDKARIGWGIYAEDGRHIGMTSLNNIDKERHLSAGWAIFIGERDYWNRGLGTETLKMVLKYSFKKLKLNRVQLGVFSFNARGVRCYEKCGFKKEGIKRQALFKNGKFVDEIIMGILKSDYNKLNKKKYDYGKK